MSARPQRLPGEADGALVDAVGWLFDAGQQTFDDGLAVNRDIGRLAHADVEERVRHAVDFVHRVMRVEHDVVRGVARRAVQHLEPGVAVVRGDDIGRQVIGGVHLARFNAGNLRQRLWAEFDVQVLVPGQPRPGQRVAALVIALVAAVPESHILDMFLEHEGPGADGVDRVHVRVAVGFDVLLRMLHNRAACDRGDQGSVWRRRLDGNRVVVDQAVAGEVLGAERLSGRAPAIRVVAGLAALVILSRRRDALPIELQVVRRVGRAIVEVDPLRDVEDQIRRIDQLDRLDQIGLQGGRFRVIVHRGVEHRGRVDIVRLRTGALAVESGRVATGGEVECRLKVDLRLGRFDVLLRLLPLDRFDGALLGLLFLLLDLFGLLLSLLFGLLLLHGLLLLLLLLRLFGSGLGLLLLLLLRLRLDDRLLRVVIVVIAAANQGESGRADAGAR